MDLKVKRLFYGLDWVFVDPDHIAQVSNTRHFAPAHPERLYLGDLETGALTDLYPIKGDPLRQRLILANKRHMPSQAICKAMNDSCDPKEFDEEIDPVASDGKGILAFVVDQSVSHLIAAGDVVTIASQHVLYIYQRQGKDWRYCEATITETEAQHVSKLLKADFGAATTRCAPTRSVVPDLSNASSDPFRN